MQEQTEWVEDEHARALILRLIGRYHKLGVAAANGLDADLAQQGQLILLQARRTFCSRCGIPPLHYAWRALVLGLGTYLAWASSPASGKASAAGRPNRIKRAPVDPEAETFAVDGGYDELEEDEWNREVRARLLALAHADDAAVRLVLGITPAGDLSRQTSRTSVDLYRASYRLRSRVGQDVVLWQLLQAKRA